MSASYPGNANFSAVNNTATPLAVGVPNTDHNTRYVFWAYNDLLGRPPDAGGASYWAGLLNSGVPRSTVSWALVNSAEYRGAVLGSYYRKFLGRSIDPTGLNYWVGQVGAGLSFEQFQSLLIGSTEYFQNGAKGQSNNAKFVQSMYQDLLGSRARRRWPELLHGSPQRRNAAPARGRGDRVQHRAPGRHRRRVLPELPEPPRRSGRAQLLGRPAPGRQPRRQLIVALIVGSNEYFSLV